MYECMNAALHTGDEQFDALPTSVVSCSKVTALSLSGLPQRPEPEWVDWAKVERGQAAWASRLGGTFTALGISLLLGFSIARFSEVLSRSGYSSGITLAQNRYVRSCVKMFVALSLCEGHAIG
jgi:hypothetical protein